jgi:hypothetical protein
MSAVTLYELTSDLRQLQSMVGEIDEQTFRDTLEGLTGEIQIKAQNVAYFVRNLESTADAIDEAVERMQARAKALRGRIASTKDYLRFQMNAAGITKIEGPMVRVAVRQNPPAVVVDDEGSLPARFMVMSPPPPPPQPRPDKKAIADALKAGETVPGAHLERGERLEVKE